MNKTITTLKYSIREFRSKGYGWEARDFNLDVTTWRKKTWFSLSLIHPQSRALDEAALPGGKNLRHVKPLVMQVGERNIYLKGLSLPSQSSLILFLNTFFERFIQEKFHFWTTSCADVVMFDQLILDLLSRKMTMRPSFLSLKYDLDSKDSNRSVGKQEHVSLATK